MVVLLILAQLANRKAESSNSLSSSDIIAFSAAVISLFSLFFTYYSVYLSKELEIKYKKFESLGIETIQKLLSSIDKVFEENPDDLVITQLQAITENLVDIELFLIQFTNIYSKLEITKISNLKDLFSDELYNNNQVEIKRMKVNYLVFRTKLLTDLYDFAILDDIGLWNRLKRIVNVS
jgi:hypothetical protein